MLVSKKKMVCKQNKQRRDKNEKENICDIYRKESRQYLQDEFSHDFILLITVTSL